MNYRQKKQYNLSIIHNFDVSVVMSFYHKLDAFKKVIIKNIRYFQRNGIEVIIVLDEPNEEDDLIKTYPFINWKVIKNPQSHLSRNHAPVLNVGIRHATKKYILISDPEVEFYSDVIYQLRNALEYYPNHYATGTVAFVEEQTIVTDENVRSLRFLNYGSIMVEKKSLELIGGYDEAFKEWGGEDDNIRKRLDMSGIQKLAINDAKSIHREETLQLNNRFIKTNKFATAELKKFFYPDEITVNDINWGKDFNNIAYDWQNNFFAEKLCRKYMSGFIDYKIKSPDIFTQNYQKIILCQSYNEIEFIDGFLKDMANYFDGIILLDDESSDGTWEKANHEKILLKVRKKRKEFNDLENRNVLLKLASFIKSEWFCFMDIDERFDERYVDFNSFVHKQDVNIVAFRGVYLWDTPDTYTSNIPVSQNGIMKRIRMFRNIGSCRINTLQNKLHFAVAPFINNTYTANILFKDYGIMKEQNRKKKFKFYLDEDTQNDLKSYDYIINAENKTLKTEDISFNKNGEVALINTNVADASLIV
jgi:hypothetical protein